jgi:hypothetical protein
LRTAKVSFCDGIPGGAIFLVAKKVGHLAAFDSVPAKFVGLIHWPSRAEFFRKFGKVLNQFDCDSIFAIRSSARLASRSYVATTSNTRSIDI